MGRSTQPRSSIPCADCATRWSSAPPFSGFDSVISRRPQRVWANADAATPGSARSTLRWSRTCCDDTSTARGLSSWGPTLSTGSHATSGPLPEAGEKERSKTWTWQASMETTGK
ncbi:MAG: hypothetical protein QM765_07630 [Myxococcales bacterium]